jgi:hypothetical protein
LPHELQIEVLKHVKASWAEEWEANRDDEREPEGALEAECKGYKKLARLGRVSLPFAQG